MADLEMPSGSQMLQQQQQQLPPPPPIRVEVEPSPSSSTTTTAATASSTTGGSSSSSTSGGGGSSSAPSSSTNASSETPSSSSITTVVVDVIATTASSVDESMEPCKKRPRVNSGDEKSPAGKEQPVPVVKQQTTDKLEYRLGGILCCAVCLDLPKSAIYQVPMTFKMYPNINIPLHSL